jgi:radical SAM superfamily enzyme YgiQ (UPF0313 family)
MNLAKKSNFAYIDAEDLFGGFDRLSLGLNHYFFFRKWLTDNYSVTQAYLFIKLIPKYISLYTQLQKAGYTLVFKEIFSNNDNLSGECYADLVLRAACDFYEEPSNNFVIVSSSDNCTGVIRFLKEKGRLDTVISTSKDCPEPIKNTGAKIAYIDELVEHLYKNEEKDSKEKQILPSDTKKDKLIIYLADLDYELPSNRHFIPLGIGSLKSYTIEKYNNLVEIHLFKKPSELIKKIREQPPHILGCSFFVWNSNLTLKMIEACKFVDDNVITIIGGPNTARNCDRYKELLSENSSLDIVALDQGEKTFSYILDRVLESDFKKELIFSKEISGCATRVHGTGEIVRGDIILGGVDISTFPSPYLAGYFDKFLQDGCVSLFETIRGCPHNCSFCGGGIGSFLPLSVRDEEDVYKEFEYVKVRAVTKKSLIADTNFGIIGDRDLRISEFMLDMYKETGFPQILYYNFTKKQTKHSNQLLLNLTELIGTLHFALQTLTPEALEKSNRKNIPLEMIRDMCERNRKSEKPVPVMVDLIFGMPGETVETFMKTIDEVLALGIEYPSVLLLKMLRGTKCAEYDREKYNYRTKFRPIEGRYGEYDLFEGQSPVRIMESEEMCCGNDYYDFDDYLTIRHFCFITRLLSGSCAFADTVFYLSSRKIMITEIFKMIRENYEKYPSLVRLFAEYEKYSRNELFESEEELYKQIACDDQEWSDLMHERGKYFKLELGFVSYYLFEEVDVLDDIQEIIFECLKSRLSEDEMNGLKEIAKHDKLFRIIQKTRDRENKRLIESDLVEDITVVDAYDYDKWRAEGFKGSINNYRFPKEVIKTYSIERSNVIKQLIQEFDSLSGYLFYEKLIMWGPRSFKRLCTTKEKTANF